MEKILLIGHACSGNSLLLAQKLKEHYGNDIIVYTPEEAHKQGLTAQDFDNIPSYKITPTPIFNEPLILGTTPTGKYMRRERRKNQRKNNKKTLNNHVKKKNNIL
jgi:hypothetical protein